jgi:hypothetical protein
MKRATKHQIAQDALTQACGDVAEAKRIVANVGIRISARTWHDAIEAKRIVAKRAWHDACVALRAQVATDQAQQLKAEAFDLALAEAEANGLGQEIPVEQLADCIRKITNAQPQLTPSGVPMSDVTEAGKQFLAQVATDQAALIAAVRKHAQDNYEKGGWDVIVECYDDADIVKAMGNATTATQAIKNVGQIARVHDSRRKDAEAEIF